MDKGSHRHLEWAENENRLICLYPCDECKLTLQQDVQMSVISLGEILDPVFNDMNQ